MHGSHCYTFTFRVVLRRLLRRIRDLNRLRTRFQGYYNRFKELCMYRTDLIWWKMILRRIRDLTRRRTRFRRRTRRSTGRRTRHRTRQRRRTRFWILKRTLVTAVSPVAENMVSGTINLNNETSV